MWYDEFEFENFKGIQTMTLPLTGNETTLIGLNESGKTTILEAIFCFSYGSEDLDAINPGLASLRDPEQWIPISQRANFNESITITATVCLDDSDKQDLRKHMRTQFGLRLEVAPSSIRISERYAFKDSRHSGTHRTWDLSVDGTKGQQRNARNYGSKTPEWQGAVAFLKERLPRIWYFPNFLFELPERFALGDASELDSEERDRNEFFKSTFEQILGNLGYGANLQTHVVERLGSSERADQRSLSATLLDMARSITDRVFGGWDRIFGRPPAAQEVELEARSDQGEPYLELKIKGPDGYYDLSERSLGFRWFFMFLLMTSFRNESSNGNKPLFLLDEPASNLHSSAQAELLKSFESLTQGCTLIYTTHSHHLINLRWLDAAYVVKNAALETLDFSGYMSSRLGVHTEIAAAPYRQFVADHSNQTSYFQPVLDLLDYVPSRLEPVPDVVLVEGKSDFYLLRYIEEVLGHESPISTVPGTGAGTLDSVIRLHIGWAKSFVVLLDGDIEGKRQAQRYSEAFGPVLAGKVLLLPEVCGQPAVKEIEHLLESSDISSIIDAVFPPGAQRPNKKKALHRAVQELYARKEPVVLTDATIERVMSLTATLAQTLEEQNPSGH